MSPEDFRTRCGPIALVTGASSSIGQSFAENLAGKGLSLLLVARGADRLQALATRLEHRHGVAVTLCPTDLAEPHAVRQVREATAALAMPRREALTVMAGQMRSRTESK